MVAAPATAAMEAIVRARTFSSCHAAGSARAAERKRPRRSPPCGPCPCTAAVEGVLIRGRDAGHVGHDRYVNELKEQLRADMTDAMRSRDQVRLRTLRMALASITNEEVSGSTVHELSHEDIVKVLTREA